MTRELEISPQGLAFFYRAPVSESKSQSKPKGVLRTPIVTLHGLLGSHKNFASLGRYFSTCGYPVICVDSRNHGASIHSAEFNYPLLAQDLEALLVWLEQQNYAQQDWSRVVVLGHSMGGRVAMMHALFYPKRLAALVSVDVVPSVQNPDIGITQIVTAMRAAERGIALSAKRQDAEKVLRTELELRGPHSEAMLQFLLLCNLQQKDDRFYSWASNLQALEAHLQDIVCWPSQWLEQNWSRYIQRQAVGEMPEAPCNPNLPVLLVAGGRSPYVQEQGWKLLLEYFPESEAAPTIKKTVESAYHWPHTEASQEFQAYVSEFLEAYGNL